MTHVVIIDTMQRTTTLVAVFMFCTAGATAQTPSIDVDPGIITADSPLYGLDVAADQVLKPPGERAHERASEALVAQEANDTASRDRALRELNETVREANGVAHSDGLANAAAILTELQDRIPDDAQPGIQTALENVQRAQDRFPTDELPDAPTRGGR